MKVKNIMFSGVMAAILGATGANAAINVASQGYVDSKVGAVESNITNNYLSKTDAEATYLTEEQVTQQITNVITAEDGAVAAAQAAADAAQGEVDALESVVAGKADSATTLAGYGITDAYTKTEVDTKVADVVAGDMSEALEAYVTTETYTAGMNLKADKAQVATDIANAVATAKEYSDSLAENYDAAGSAAAVEAKLADYTKTSELNATFATDQELGEVDAKFANYTTTEALNTKLNDYAKQVDLEAEVTARDTAVKAVDAKLADYTKTADLDKGFVSESEMTEFKTANTAAINAKVAQSDYDTTVAALNAKDTELADDISQLESDLTSKITMPEVCATTNCVLSTLGGTVQWVPLTEPLDSTASN